MNIGNHIDIIRTNCDGCKWLIKMGYEEPCASCIDYNIYTPVQSSDETQEME